ncbi:hypothetical protein [Streptomyces sp. NPDC012746]|uniref:hypothetical protein n=1 Tax=Streptomyces sp. NPDC012746 TaxID=3364845 RepID=UPI00367BD094
MALFRAARTAVAWSARADGLHDGQGLLQIAAQLLDGLQVEGLFSNAHGPDGLQLLLHRQDEVGGGLASVVVTPLVSCGPGSDFGRVVGGAGLP